MSRKLYRITTTLNHPDNMAGFYKDDKEVFVLFCCDRVVQRTV